MTLLLLVCQSVLAVLAIEVLRRRVWPILHDTAYPEIVLDVWGPVILILPGLFLLGRVDGSVSNAWLPIGGPIGVGAIGLAASLAIGRPSEPSPLHQPVRLVSMVCWGFVGVFLLLLGAAHELNIGIGQIAFAIAAVMLWMHTPAAVQHSMSRPADGAIGRWLLVGLGLAVAQGIVARAIASDVAAISGAIIIATSGAGLVAAAVQLGPFAATRLAGWSAALGPLFAVGVLSLLNLIPTVLSTGDAWIASVAFGFGHFAPEAVGLMGGAAAVALLAGRSRGFFVVGFVLIVLVAGGIAWRLVHSTG